MGDGGVVGVAAGIVGERALQFDQSAATVQLAVASFHEQVKLAALAAGARAQRARIAIANGGKAAGRALKRLVAAIGRSRSASRRT